MPFDLGDTVRLAAESRNAGGTLTNATSAVLTVTLPDGTTVMPSVTNPPAQTGAYSVDYVTAQAGRHAVRWVFTTPNSAYTDAFDVREAAPPLIISLADAKAHLNIPAATTTNDEELRGWLESITGVIEGFVGAVVRQTVTEVHDTGAAGVVGLALRKPPVLSLTSVTAVLDGGDSYTVGDLDVDVRTGLVCRADGGRLCGRLRVTYTAGRPIVPATVRDAAKIILKHLWQTQLGPGRPAPGGGEDYAVTEPVVGFGYAIPNRALQLLEPHRLPPGVA